MDEKGNIWKKNIKISVDNENLKVDMELKVFLKNFDFANKFKIKEIIHFEKSLKNKFKEYNIKSHKILSRGKCRGFFYTFNRYIVNFPSKENEILNLIINSLAVGLENYWLIKTKKSTKI